MLRPSTGPLYSAIAPAAMALLLSFSPSVMATPRLPRSQLHDEPQPRATQPESCPTPAAARADALARLPKIAAFEAKMQYALPCAPDAGVLASGDGGVLDCDLGGIIEVESGPGSQIIESDNTHEGIWDWSFERQQLGKSDHAMNASHAFEYLGRYPGYLEWQDTTDGGPDYYSVYNCGWGVRAVLEYEAATGDHSHHDYGVQCAKHLRDNAMAVAMSSDSLIEKGTAAWGASGLWLWGDASGDAADKTAAAAVGASLKAWLDASAKRPALTTWAISGGAVFYGVVNSYMKEHPDELDAWVRSTAPSLGGWIDESKPVARPSGQEWTDWRNAWNEWNMLAQFTAARALGGSDGDAHAQIALDIYAKLGAEDRDDDGGIPGSAARPDTEDQSWITSYLAYFGVREVLALGEGCDAGAGSDGGAPAMRASGCEIGTRSTGPMALAALVSLALLTFILRRRS